MNGGWRYRIAGVFGTLAITVAAVVLAYEPLLRGVLDLVPVLQDLPADRATGAELAIEAAVAAVVVLAVLIPLYKPRPRRILDTWMVAIRRVAIAVLGLATIGYFDYSYRLPRATLILTGALLLLVLPLYFVVIRRRPGGHGDRTVVVGDSPDAMTDVLAAIDGDVLGYVSPPTATEASQSTERRQYADGGTASTLADLPTLGGLSRLEEVLVQHDVDTAVLAFDRTDRAEFFGALDACYDHGVRAMVHRGHADAVLTSDTAAGDLVEIDLEPWDWQDHVFKRLFDVTFAAVGLLALSPIALIVAVAVKAEDGGPILYRQERTAALGDTFTIAKFRTMRLDGERTEPLADDRNPRITRIGGFLRRTHLDEIPQLVPILLGHMSVVGPRPVWTDEELHLEAIASDWRKRWFVKPGLTGLAQVNDVSSTDPETKLRYDIQYIREQGFWFDLKIVIRQLWLVGRDLVSVTVGGGGRE